MYHSVTFDSRNTYTNWHLVPEGIPIIAMPEQKKQTVEVPGGDGVLDLSMSLTKYPLYNRRSGELTFRVLDGYDTQTIRDNMAQYLHGRRRKMILEDDPDYYYYGYYAVAWTHNNDGTMPTVTISYDLEPYKKSNEIIYADTVSGSQTYTSGAWKTLTTSSADDYFQFSFSEDLHSYTFPTPVVIEVNSMSSGAKINVGYFNSYLGINVSVVEAADSGWIPITQYIITKTGTHTIGQYPITSRGTSYSEMSGVDISRHSTYIPSGGSIKLRAGYRRAML